MGWPVAAELPVPPSDNSITVALIGAAGLVLVAIIGAVSTALSRKVRTTSAPGPDPKLGERVAVVERDREYHTRTLEVIDRHVHGVDDAVDRLRWEMDDMKAWRESHDRRHGLL